MKGTLRRMYWVVEINLLLWLALAGGGLVSGRLPGTGNWLSAKVGVNEALLYAGLGFAVIFQHWAYYALYKKARKLGVAVEG